MGGVPTVASQEAEPRSFVPDGKSRTGVERAKTSGSRKKKPLLWCEGAPNRITCKCARRAGTFISARQKDRAVLNLREL